jgi:hypothetical protein
MLKTAAEHGSSLNRFVHGLFGYPGPVVLVIQDEKNDTFGGYLIGGTHTVCCVL